MPGLARFARYHLVLPAKPDAGHPRLDFAAASKTWMAGTSPAMTVKKSLSFCILV